MNKFFYLFLLLVPYYATAQELKGKVIDEKTNQPLEMVSVFVNTTTIGTVTNAKGEFSLSIKPGRYELIVSIVGYEPIVYALEAPFSAPLLFKLRSKTYALKTVSVKAKRDASWYDNLQVFKENFLGRSEVARKCVLLNPDNLVIVFHPHTGLLEVSSEEPLEIENPELGYKIHYTLVEFKYFMKEGYVTFLGYQNYEPMKAGKSRQRKWDKNRQKAYRGSTMHFVRALRAEKLEQEGFNLRRLLRIPNPNRPTEAEFEALRARLRTRGTITSPNDPDQVMLSKASLPKIIEKLDTTRVPYTDYLIHSGEDMLMRFKGYFQVVYTGEKEEPAYVHFTSGSRPRQPSFQTSVFYLRADQVILEKNGSITPPLDIMFEGYWGWEKLGDMLPLDY
ncbi:MAG: carboxypeptidase-like regulatory domain-containing protein [Siphonobacter sp.]